MKIIINKILFFFSDLLGLIKPLIYHLQYQHFKNEIININPNRPLIIMGNGPSAKVEIEKQIENKTADICTVNFSGISDYFFSLQPQYYVFSDPNFHIKKNEGNFSKLFSNFEEVDWNMILYIPYYFPKSFKKDIEKNKNIKIFRFCQVDWEPNLFFFKKLKCFFYKRGLLAPKIKNVIVPCICTGILRGYRDIYLYGVEHTWTKSTFVNEKNQVMLMDEHFYGNKTTPWMSYGKPCKMHILMQMMHDVFKSYWSVRDFADSLGNVRIINCTKGSFIDAFERKME